MPKWSQKRKASHPTKYAAPRQMSPGSKAKHRRLQKQKSKAKRKMEVAAEVTTPAAMSGCV